MPATLAIPLSILSVEDNADHAAPITELSQICDARVHLARAEEGGAALAHLTSHRNPDAVLIDMPGMDGHQPLQEIKNDLTLSLIPEVVPTTSRGPVTPMPTATCSNPLTVTSQNGCLSVSSPIGGVHPNSERMGCRRAPCIA